jgi:hypothetical protein
LRKSPWIEALSSMSKTRLLGGLGLDTGLRGGDLDDSCRKHIGVNGPKLKPSSQLSAAAVR